MLNSVSRKLLLALLASAFVLTACGEDPEENQNQNQDGHEAAGAVEIETRGAQSALLARWTAEDGWRDANGDAITELPTPVDTEGGLEDFVENGDRASLTVRFIDADGTEIPMDTVSRDDDTRERECTEYSTRYYAVDDNTDVIAWPVTHHPDAPDGSFQFVIIDDEPAGIFHCNHIHIYPQAAGTADVEFVLWHVDHADDRADPLTIRVNPAE